jgi:hypothetical protein
MLNLALYYHIMNEYVVRAIQVGYPYHSVNTDGVSYGWD